MTKYLFRKSENWVLETDGTNSAVQFAYQCFPNPGLKFLQYFYYIILCIMFVFQSQVLLP